MVIDSKKIRAAALIMSIILSAVITPIFGANDPNALSKIRTSVSNIAFAQDDITKGFRIWNAGTGILSYRLDINGTDANYFSIDDANVGEDVNGQSADINDEQGHNVTVKTHTKTLNAQIVITNESNNADVNYITLTAPINDQNEPNEPNTNPVIGTSTKKITLEGNIVSKRFRIWNKGTGPLSYTLSVVGNDAENFSLDREEGNSTGVFDKKTHTVYVDYGDLHNITLHAQIEIADGNGNSAFINLSATETIATRVSHIEIEQGRNSDDTEDIRMDIVTDSTVADVNISAPEGAQVEITDFNETSTGMRNWTFLGEDGLENYGDGRYTIFVTYTDDSVADTNVNFGIPDKPGTIVWPTQIPVLTSPGNEDQNVSPLKFEWEKCVDVNTNAIRLVLVKPCDNETGCDNNSIERQYSKRTTRSPAINLEPGAWLSTLSFGRWYQGENDDGIEFDVGKCTRSQSDVNIMKWFGTLSEDLKNHPLKLRDCNGTEVTFNLTGGGWGAIVNENESDCGFESIELTGTTDKSVLSISTKKSVKISVGNITADGDIKAIIGRNVNLEGNIDIAGGAGLIVLNNVAGDEVTGPQITIGSPASSKITTCALNFGQINNLRLRSNTPIRNLWAANWLNGLLDAPWISTMTIRGDFGANMNLLGEDSPKSMALRKAVISGNITAILDDELNYGWAIGGNCGSIAIATAADTSFADITGNVGAIKATGNRKTGLTANLSGGWHFGSVKTITAGTISFCEIQANGPVDENIPDIGTITVKGWIADSTISAIALAGDIGTIKAGAIQNCNGIFATGTIRRVEITGIRNETFCYINSNIDANYIGFAYIGFPKYSNDGTPFGVTAGSIGKITVRDSSQKMTLTDMNSVTDSITIQDFGINVGQE